MILGAGEGQLPIIKRAKQAGWRTIVVSPQGDYPGFKIADASFYYDLSNKEEILKIAEKESISAIATDQTDISVPTVLFVAKKMGLPHIDCRDIDNFRFKSLMRDICHSFGIPTIPYCVTDNFQEASNFFCSLSSRVAIMKPVDSQGSRGVQKVSSILELADSFLEAKKHSSSGYVIIERFIDGKEIEVDAVVKDGDIKCTLIGDVYNFDLKNTFSAYIREYPTQLPARIQREIIRINGQILSALGLVTGWTHGEYMYSTDGMLYLLEVGARGGGSFIGSDIIREMMGVGTDEMAFDLAIGDKSFFERVFLHDVFCAYRCFYLPEGEVFSINILEGYLEKSFILAHNLDKIYVGMRTHENTDKTSRFTIVIKEDSRASLKKRLLEVEQSICILIKTPKGIQGAIWR